jgi:uncharacterized protein (TIGR01777 family)
MRSRFVHTFVREKELPVSAASAFSWHERPGALDRLLPPWERIRVDRRADHIQDGARVELVNRLGPMALRWVAEHYDYQRNVRFRDRLIRGPFSLWDHLHQFQPGGSNSSQLRDEVQYRLPGSWLGSLMANWYVQKQLHRMFAFRHDVTFRDLQTHSRYKEHKAMHVAMTGSRGLIGSELTPLLTTGGHRVTRIVHQGGEADDLVWPLDATRFDPTELEGVDAVVHLAGENIAGGKWSEVQKQRIRESRVERTRQLCSSLAAMSSPPKVLIAASAIGYYADRGSEVLDEGSSAGTGFLAEVAQDWEAATQVASEAGIRVVNLRIGVVLSPRGGALESMLTPFQLGGGGKIGDGRQYFSWVCIDDVAGAILHALMDESLCGPVNAVAPHPVTNEEFTKTLGKVLRRPTILRVPAFAVKLMWGEMGEELLLASTRVVPQRLLQSNYEFRHGHLEDALRFLLGR